MYKRVKQSLVVDDVLILIGAPKNLKRLIHDEFSRDNICRSFCVDMKTPSPRTLSRSLHTRGIFQHDYVYALGVASGCVLDTERIPNVSRNFKFAIPSDEKSTVPGYSLKTANFLNHVLFLQRSMEVIVERSGDYDIAHPEIVGIPKNLDNIYQRSSY